MQREAVTTVSGPALVLAGAGSGKTRALTHRIAYLIEEGINPWNILAITFTNKAADEMRERVDRLVKIGAESVWISTFHSMCVRILRRHIEYLGYGTDFTVYDSDDQRTLMRQVIKKLDKDPKQYRERGMLSIISGLKDKLISPEEYSATAAYDFRQRNYAEIYAEYQAQLKRNNALDFDDLIVKTVELFRAVPQVLENYQDRFQYIMVDEYQDTNAAQFALVSLLARRDRNLWVVGDDDQSIYKFRGADIENILNFEKVFPGAKVIRLEQNYRSTGNILKVANEVIAHNYGRKGKNLWTENGAGESVEVRQFETAQDEAAYIMKQVRKYVEEGGNYRDCVVLYRTNAQTRILEEMADRYIGQHYRTLGVNFYDRREIKDVIAYLRTICNGRDDLAVQRIINVPKRGIGATSLGRVADYAELKGISLYDACTEAALVPGIGKAAGKIRGFVEQIEMLRELADEISIVDLIDEILSRTGYREYLMEEDDVQAESRLEYIGALKDKAAYYEGDTDEPTLSEFLEDIPLRSDQDNLDREEDKMLLMTLHSAKGLEFPVVFLAGMEDGLFPSSMSINSDDPEGAIEEERRLCYVGITRAEKRLVMTAARQRMVNGENRYSKLSRFIYEVPGTLLEMKGTENPSQRRREESLSFGTPYGAEEETYRGKYSFQNGFSGGFSRKAGHSGRTDRYAENNPGWQNGARKRSFGDRLWEEGSEVHYPFGDDPWEKVFDLDKEEEIVRFGGEPTEQLPERRKFQGSPCSKGSQIISSGVVPDYGVGDRVSHVKFGEGIVLHLEKAARDYEVTVQFDTAGKKRMYAAFAKLKRI